MTNEELVAEYQKGNEAAFNELLKQNMGIIHHMIARWFQKVKDGTITTEYLENECTYAFWLAVKDFKIDSDVLFSTCAFNRIRWHLGRILNNGVKKTATGEEVHVVSFDDIVPGTEKQTYEDLIPDEEAEQMMQNLFNRCDQQSLHDDLMQLLDELLSEKEKQIILMHYGIGCKPCSQADIGKHFNIADSRVGQIESTAMKKIQSSPVTEYFANKYRRIKAKNRKQIIKKEHKQRIQKAMESNQKSVSTALNFFGI